MHPQELIYAPSSPTRTVIKTKKNKGLDGTLGKYLIIFCWATFELKVPKYYLVQGDYIKYFLSSMKSVSQMYFKCEEEIISKTVLKKWVSLF